jgi:putative ATP-binding cassette transporter
MRKILRMLSGSSISYINSGKTDGPVDLYDAVLECGEDGSWTLRGERAGQMVAAP